MTYDPITQLICEPIPELDISNFCRKCSFAEFAERKKDLLREDREKDRYLRRAAVEKKENRTVTLGG